MTRLTLAPSERNTFGGLAIAGGAVALAGAISAPDRMWGTWLLVGYYLVGLALAGVCFVAIHYTSGATWSVAIRRVAEAMAGTLPIAVAMLAVVFIVRPQLYAWTSGALAAEGGSAMAFKRVWLSRPFFLTRAATYAAIWMLFVAAIRRQSLAQDGDGDVRRTQANVVLSAAFLVVFGVTFTLASVDWIMSLEPLWYSTMFGVYNFAGLFLSGLAALIVLSLWLERRGPLRHVLNEGHLHDLGTLLFSFSIFWMYIWFSQYMLVWYTNIPEESSYFVRRMHGGWFVLTLVTVALNWAIPFSVLIRRDAKRQRVTLGLVSAVVLAGRALDLYLMIFPSVVGAAPKIGLWEIGVAAGGVGVFVLVLARILGASPAVPVADPHLAESLRYEH